MRVSLNCLLEGSHLLNFEHLSSPLLIDGPSLIAFNPELVRKSLLLLLQSLDFFLQLLYFLVRLLTLFTLEPVHCFEQAIRVFHFVLDKWPQLLEESTQIFRLFLGLLELLVEQLFTVAQQADQLFVLRFQKFYLFHVRSLPGLAFSGVARTLGRLDLLEDFLARVLIMMATLLTRCLVMRAALFDEGSRAGPVARLSVAGLVPALNRFQSHCRA